MFKPMVVCVIIVGISDVTETKTQYRNSYILRYNGTLGEAAILEISEYGYKLEKRIFEGYYQFRKDVSLTRSAESADDNMEDLKIRDKKFVSFQQEEVYYRTKRLIQKDRKRRSVSISDANWTDQWNLNPGHVPSMGVYSVWGKGYMGQGVTVAVIDDGIDVTHVDLTDNYNVSLSYDYIYNTADASHANVGEGQGTNCAGIIAAGRNEHCVIGIAYEAKILAIRLVDSVYGATPSEEASALIHQLENIDIYSNSWGPEDDGAGFDPSDGISSIQEAALLKGVTEGRNGKGVIYTWAAGNGGAYFDDCNVDGYSNTIYSISINSLAPDTAPAWYAEECTAVMAATYGGDDTQDTVATTSPGNQCIDDFQGTSAACPVASGIIALVLQANPDLTWRDVQHLIVEYSTNTGLTNAYFYTNAVGKKVSLSHGFGLMNAEAMVDVAPTWITVPSQISCQGTTQYVYKSSTALTSIVSTWTNEYCFIKYLEHVQVSISFQAEYRENTQIYLVSPGGTESRILRERPNDIETGTVSWKFMSLHTWGENPSGTWTLRMDSSLSSNTLNLNTWSLTFFGTATDPLHGIEDGNVLIKRILKHDIVAC
ncbi:furin-like protease kpc-1 [Mercenaria mercenaria]|uniref:furin-like protease kpc-1 n=1 Tax=Mercenaria mercenaria TaxID=6596 RepID=UPI00234F54AB|nr:furin-like protease kpc-1 [Mercenaria mercenaria]